MKWRLRTQLLVALNGDGVADLLIFLVNYEGS